MRGGKAGYFVGEGCCKGVFGGVPGFQCACACVCRVAERRGLCRRRVCACVCVLPAGALGGLVMI